LLNRPKWHQHESRDRGELEFDQGDEELNGQNEEGDHDDQPGDHQHEDLDEVFEERDVAHELAGGLDDWPAGIVPTWARRPGCSS
jgi:hypothetical protein